MKLNVNLPHHPYDTLVEKEPISGWKVVEPALAASESGQYGQSSRSTLCGKVKLSFGSMFETFVFDFLEGEASKNLKTVNRAYEFLVKA